MGIWTKLYQLQCRKCKLAHAPPLLWQVILFWTAMLLDRGITIVPTLTAGSLFKSSWLSTEKAFLIFWSNFHGLSTVTLQKYLTIAVGSLERWRQLLRQRELKRVNLSPAGWNQRGPSRSFTEDKHYSKEVGTCSTGGGSRGMYITFDSTNMRITQKPLWLWKSEETLCFIHTK